MPDYDKVLELVEVLKLDSDNTIKKVTLNVKTFDTTAPSVFAQQPMVAVLTSEDYANSEVVKVSTANTAVDIALWGYEYVGGDTYYENTIKDNAERTVVDLLQFQGTSTVDITALP